jgi:hypothetical protein
MEDVNRKVMGIFKKYKVVIMIVAPILILVLFRSFSDNHFQSDAKRWAEPSVTRTNIITREKANSLSDEILMINLGGVKNTVNEAAGNTFNILPDSILIRKNLNAIRKHNGPVLLCSSETAISARIWMILSQMGISNVYILANESENEVFKNKFRPDTLVRPEL